MASLIPCPQKLILMYKVYGLQYTVSRIWGTAVLEESMGVGGSGVLFLSKHSLGVVASSGPKSVSFLKGFYGRVPHEDKAGPLCSRHSYREVGKGLGRKRLVQGHSS